MVRQDQGENQSEARSWVTTRLRGSASVICRLAIENARGVRKIQAELEKLGFTVSLATVSRYLSKREPDGGQRQRWITLLRNHERVIAGMDFFVVPTVRFRLVYLWFVMEPGRRRIHTFQRHYESHATVGGSATPRILP